MLNPYGVVAYAAHVGMDVLFFQFGSSSFRRAFLVQDVFELGVDGTAYLAIIARGIVHGFVEDGGILVLEHEVVVSKEGTFGLSS